MKWLMLLGILLLTSSLSAQQARSTRDNDVSLGRAQEQRACEKKILDTYRAKEITGGLEYQALSKVASAFGRKNVPHFYIAEIKVFHAQYIFGSLQSDGRGKILASRKLISFLGNVSQAFDGLLAHEVAHLESDDGTVSCDQSLKDLRDPKEEEATDALAADKVGYSPLRVILLKLKELCEGKSEEVDTRLQALEVLEKKEARQR